MTIISTTVTPTTAYLRDTVTLASEVSETISGSHLAMWIIDFDETTDSSTTIFELINQGRVINDEWSPFVSKNDRSSEVQIDESMLEAHTLTFILVQGGSTWISISDNPELFTIGDPINVSFKLHLYDKVKKLGNQWFYLKDEVNTLLSAKAESIHGHSIEETNLFNVLNCVNNNFDNLGGEIVFSDDCSSDMSSQYNVRGHIKEGTYPITINYESSEPCYDLSASGGESFTWFVIPNLQGLDNIRITATVMIEDYNTYSQIFLGLCDTLEQTDSSNYKFDFVRIRGDDKLDAIKNNSEQFSNNNVSVTDGELVKLVFERIGNNITGKVYNEDGSALLSWNSYTTTNEYSNPYYFLGLMSKWSYYYYYLYELKAEWLII